MKVSVPKVRVISSIQHVPLFKCRDFLYRKYVLEKLSATEIAAEASSVRSSVLKHLRLFGIPVRGTGQGIRKRRNLFYGRRIVNREETAHKAELEAIERMRGLRARGFSFWKIADAFNTLKVPTKTRRGRWHARSIKKVLDDNAPSPWPDSLHP